MGTPKENFSFGNRSEIYYIICLEFDSSCQALTHFWRWFVSGHSKWATIRRKKEKVDAARGRVFTRLIRELQIAAREGGSDETSNARLRTAIAAAKASNMPAANIEKAIKRGTGELPGVTYEQVSYECYGPGGVALLIEVTTDNRNRTVSEIRHILTKRNGSMGETGSVNWMFERKGTIAISKEGVDEDELMMAALEAGADDVVAEDSEYTVYTTPESLEDVREALEKNYQIQSAESSMIPQSTVKVEGGNASMLLNLLEDLEEHDDVQHVYANFDIDDALLERAE
jgi:YebC/PmpR family DNA-binding regulatory protein